MLNLRSISYNQLILTFVPFAFATSWAVFSAIASPEVDFARARHFIWISLAFATAAACRYIFTYGKDVATDNLWRLLWLFAWLAYVTHFYYGFGIMFQGTFDAVFARQGTVVASSNFLLTVVWTVSVILAWVAPYRGIYATFTTLIIAFAIVSFLMSSLLFGTGFVRLLGAAAVLALLITLTIRFVRPVLEPS